MLHLPSLVSNIHDITRLGFCSSSRQLQSPAAVCLGKGHLTAFKYDHIKRKMRRRSCWGRGIIRKKKYYKCKEAEEEEEEEAEEEGEGDASCLTQDEDSSCDTTGPQTNGHLPHLPSTEEESSNEPPEQDAAAKDKSAKATETRCPDDQTKIERDKRPSIEMSESSDTEPPQPKHTAEGLLVSRVECVNGNESMDSLDSHSLPSSSETGGSRTVLDNGPAKSEAEEHKDTPREGRSTQEQSPEEEEEEEAAATASASARERAEEETNKEGCSDTEKCSRSESEQLKEPEHVVEKCPPVPAQPVIIDHQRLLVSVFYAQRFGN
ncbi:hypothetical protein WMY93_015787 [Mugilogobius chulae]|uniref:Uncharacterized protein n=1 Tax=Mugilogobius chulae TaxID=88201 RepID=A0AAW0NRK1_9GOBI